MATVGERVTIIEDCRDGAPATGQIGVFMGYYDLDTGEDRNDAPWHGNPFIRLDNGSGIWGCECWWSVTETTPPMEEAKASLEERKAGMRQILNSLIPRSMWRMNMILEGDLGWRVRVLTHRRRIRAAAYQ